MNPASYTHVHTIILLKNTYSQEQDVQYGGLGFFFFNLEPNCLAQILSPPQTQFHGDLQISPQMPRLWFLSLKKNTWKIKLSDQRGDHRAQLFWDQTTSSGHLLTLLKQQFMTYLQHARKVHMDVNYILRGELGVSKLIFKRLFQFNFFITLLLPLYSCCPL